MRVLLLAGSLCGATGVALGAFGAHGLRDILAPDMLDAWRTATQYHLVHAAVIVAIALAPSTASGLRVAGWLLVAGIALFSGSLYLLAATGVSWLGAITPFGGAAFIAGWLLLARAAWRMETSAA